MRTKSLDGKFVALAATSLLVALSVLYYGIGSVNETRAESGYAFWEPKLALDDYVPYVAGWAWVYLSFFPFCLGLAALVRFTLKKLAVYASAFIMQYVVGGAFFWMMPSRITPPSQLGTSFAERVLMQLHALDGGFNVFPSMHVANAVLVTMCLWVEQSRWKWIYLVWGCGIIVSTALVKRHYVIDIPGGVLLGVAAGYGVYSALRPTTMRPRMQVRMN